MRCAISTAGTLKNHRVGIYKSAKIDLLEVIDVYKFKVTMVDQGWEF